MPLLFLKGGENMLKRYLVNGKEWQFEEGKQPDGAVEVKQKEPSEKSAKSANKARKAATK